jgi:hypothetical protein
MGRKGGVALVVDSFQQFTSRSLEKSKSLFLLHTTTKEN